MGTREPMYAKNPHEADFLQISKEQYEEILFLLLCNLLDDLLYCFLYSLLDRLLGYLLYGFLFCCHGSDRLVSM